MKNWRPAARPAGTDGVADGLEMTQLMAARAAALQRSVSSAVSTAPATSVLGVGVDSAASSGCAYSDECVSDDSFSSCLGEALFLLLLITRTQLMGAGISATASDSCAGCTMNLSAPSLSAARPAVRGAEQTFWRRVGRPKRQPTKRWGAALQWPRFAVDRVSSSPTWLSNVT